MLKRRSSLTLCAFGLICAAATADAAVVSCTFGSGQQTTDLTLITPDGAKKARTRAVEMRVAPGAAGEQSAIATYVTRQESSINQPYVQILFHADTNTGFVVRVAENGDGVTFPIDRIDNLAGTRHLGWCEDPEILFGLWY